MEQDNKKPHNPLVNVPKIIPSHTILFSSATRNAEANIVRRRAKSEAETKGKHIELTALEEQESDTEIKEGKKNPLKATNTMLKKKVTKARTFINSLKNENIQISLPDLNVSLIPQDNSAQLPYEGEKEETSYLTLQASDIKPPNQQQKAQKSHNKREVMEDDEESELSISIAPKQKKLKTEVTQEGQQKPMQPSKIQTGSKGRPTSESKEISESAKKKLPLLEFFEAVEPEVEDPLLSSYFQVSRIYSSLYDTISSNYDLINQKTKKRNKVGIEDDMLNKVMGINSNQKYPVLLTRKYEQSMMRTVIPGSKERQCLNGNECEFFFMYGKVKQAGVECLYPNDRLEFERTGKLPDKIETCILCKRRLVTIHHMNARSACGNMSRKMLFQTHYNQVEIDGEYCLSNCIMSAETEIQYLLLPVVYHVRSFYRQVMSQPGVWMYEQIGYSKPENVKNERKDFY